MSGLPALTKSVPQPPEGVGPRMSHHSCFFNFLNFFFQLGQYLQFFSPHQKAEWNYICSLNFPWTHAIGEYHEGKLSLCPPASVLGPVLLTSSACPPSERKPPTHLSAYSFSFFSTPFSFLHFKRCNISHSFSLALSLAVIVEILWFWKHSLTSIYVQFWPLLDTSLLLCGSL